MGTDQQERGKPDWRSAGARQGEPEVPFGNRRREFGAAGWGLLWLLGVPIPILVILFVLRGCT